MSTINWKDVEIGSIYKYEEGYHMQAEIRVIEKMINDNPSYVEYKIKVIVPVWGCEKDEIYTVGKSLDNSMAYLVNNMKFKTLDDWFDYITPGNIL